MRRERRALLSMSFPTPWAWLLLAVVALALGLRVWNLQSLPIFHDEAIYLRWARDIWDQRTRAALLIPIREDGKQPLFMWLAGAAMGMPVDPLVAGRLVSVLAGVASTVGLFLAGRWLAGNRVGLVAALFYATAPFTLLFDRMALADGLLNTTIVWSVSLGIFVARHGESRKSALLGGTAMGVLLGAAIWTKMTALFLIPFPMLCLLAKPRSAGWGSRLLGFAASYLLFAALGALLAAMPDAENLWQKSEQFSIAPEQLLSLPVKLWSTNAASYWSWFQSYLPAPLYWLVLAAIPWGLLCRRRHTLLLVACWGTFTLPLLLTATLIFTTRYVLPGVFPLLLLAAELLVWLAGWLERQMRGWSMRRRLHPRQAHVLAALTLLLAVPSLAFDADLLADPTSANLAQTDRFQYVRGWPSGYGLPEAIDLVRQTAGGFNREVIVLSDHFQGVPKDALDIYLRGMPHVHHYVDGHIPWGGSGLVEAWQAHHVPLILVVAQGRDDVEAFERQLPEARRIGLFWKPGMESSYRVYVVDPS